MADVERHFRLFSKLPIELRLAIWRECLPHRVCQIDLPVLEKVFDIDYKGPFPCTLISTNAVNASPPVISRVCHESRRVAFETGGYAEPRKDVPEDARWTSWNDWGTSQWWRDRARDSTHLSWTPFYNDDWVCDGDPLKFLAWHAARMSGGCSLMEGFFTDRPAYMSAKLWADLDGMDDSDDTDDTDDMQFNKRSLAPLEARELEVLKRLPECLVVMRFIVVHADLKTAASTGLFGLLGDAQVQIIDVTDERRVDALFDLAEQSERKYRVTVGQDFHRPSAESVKQELKETLLMVYGSEDLVESLRPAYMFRLCTAMCNQVGRKEPVRPPPIRG